MPRGSGLTLGCQAYVISPILQNWEWECGWGWDWLRCLYIWCELIFKQSIREKESAWLSRILGTILQYLARCVPTPFSHNLVLAIGNWGKIEFMLTHKTEVGNKRVWRYCSHRRFPTHSSLARCTDKWFSYQLGCPVRSLWCESIRIQNLLWTWNLCTSKDTATVRGLYTTFSQGLYFSILHLLFIYTKKSYFSHQLPIFSKWISFGLWKLYGFCGP